MSVMRTGGLMKSGRCCGCEWEGREKRRSFILFPGVEENLSVSIWRVRSFREFRVIESFVFELPCVAMGSSNHL